MRNQRRPINMHFGLLALSLAAIGAAAYAADSKVSCLAEIPASALHFGDAPKGWTATTQTYPLHLTAAGFSSGPPSDRAQLKPTSVDEAKAKIVETWRFEGPYPRGKWLSCDFERGVVTLSREIPEGIRECSVVYDNHPPASPALREIVCR